ncbi:MAG: DUF2231 domain-containing protein [Acidobacteriota bacterium]|nr:DUF2231 domain-containing protein [Acidobacteriota bacterium]
MASPASFNGHPIHPMLIPFPLALWFSSFVADVIYLWRGNPIWKDWIAFYTLLGGTIMAAVAAVPGFLDWLSLKDRDVVRIANWHARLNVIALVVFAASFYLRTTSGASLVGGSYTIPFVLSVVGVILITISGWLGGELVFKHAVAVDTQAGTGAEGKVP